MELARAAAPWLVPARAAADELPLLLQLPVGRLLAVVAADRVGCLLEEVRDPVVGAVRVALCVPL